jgi:peptidoglycan/xylan/chitin deacetylase (PgdA/CDA1 family)
VPYKTEMKSVLLSFDIEEFDMPVEYGKYISFEDQIRISKQGTTQILDLLRQHRVNATFFSTVVFAKQSPELIERIRSEGHELASHSYYHSQFEPAHLSRSKKELELLSGLPVTGFRMPRMMPVNTSDLIEAGYEYNSSLNPTYLPGRYNNLSRPRTFFLEQRLLQLPASVTPLVRFPLFWISFHNIPLPIYNAMCRRTINHDGYLNIYFHPWEFTDLTSRQLGMPGFVSRNSGKKMARRFDSWVGHLKENGYSFSTISAYLKNAAVSPKA